MKDHAPIIQFSGYPLKVADDQQESLVVPLLPAQQRMLKSDKAKPSVLASNPKSWDEDWFGNYE